MALTESPTRCSICRSFDKPVWDIEDFALFIVFTFGVIKYTFNLKDALESGQSGCNGCRLISDTLHDLVVETNEDYGVQFDVRQGKDEAGSRLRVSLFVYRNDKPDEHVRVVNFHATSRALTPSPFHSSSEAVISPIAFLENAPGLSDSTGSDESVAQVRSWLDECSEKHTVCQKSSPSSLPTRVIDIEGPGKVRLHISNGELDEYACLSHCWGALPLIQTTSSTLDKYKTGIPWDELPKTFRDAIAFTYTLGLRYLWIDSLCILQDSSDDWLREGSRMSHIYEGAYVTLAASISLDASGGCFVPRDPKHRSQPLKLTDPEGKPYDIYHRAPLEHSELAQQLDTRAWAFQERVLSRRTVRFMEQEIWWECHQHIACECSRIENDQTMQGRHESQLAESLREAVPGSWTKDTLDIEQAWEFVVLEYKTKSLTHSSDIFAALQGLAKIVPPMMGEYLAGHWRETLIHNLSWTRWGRRTHLLAPAHPHSHPLSGEWRAPTWSWASSPGYIMWGLGIRARLLRTSLCTVVHASTVPQGSDPTGPITSAKLILKGTCLNGIVMHYPNDPESSSDAPKHSVDFGLDDDRFLVLDGKLQINWDYDIASEGPHHIENGEEVTVLKISMEADESGYHWLFLRKVRGGEEYERVGIMFLYVLDDSGPDMVKILDEAAQELEVTII